MSKRKQKKCRKTSQVLGVSAPSQAVNRRQPRRTFLQELSQPPDEDESTPQTPTQIVAQDLPQQTITQIPTRTSPTIAHFPDEILWEIFRTFLLSTQWTGWPALVRLDQEKRKRLLSDTTFIRTTLPVLYDGVLPSLRNLIQKMHEKVNEDYQAGILQVINGVASGLRYDKHETYDGIRKMMSISGERPGFVYISLFQLAGFVEVKYGANQSWKVVLSDMKTMKEDPLVQDEYERYVGSLVRYGGAHH